MYYNQKYINYQDKVLVYGFSFLNFSLIMKLKWEKKIFVSYYWV